MAAYGVLREAGVDMDRVRNARQGRFARTTSDVLRRR